MRTVKNYVGIILCACVIIFIYKTFDISLFSNILSAFIPLIVGAILAYFLQPLVYKFEMFLDSFQNKKLIKYSHTISSIFVFVVFVLIIVVLMIAIIPALVNYVVNIADNLTLYIKNFEQTLETYLGSNLASEVIIKIDEMVVKYVNSIEAIDPIATLGTIFKAGSTIITAVLGLIFTPYVLIEAKKLVSIFDRLCSLFMSKEKIEQTSKNKSKSKAIEHINNTYFQGIMGPSWYNDIDIWFRKYCFDEQVMIALFDYCYKRSALHRNYVQTVAEAWASNKVKTWNDLDTYYQQQESLNKIKKSIAKKLGKYNGLTQYEEAYIENWILNFGYDMNIIEIALKRTTFKQNPTFEYINNIITDWHDRNLKTPSEITAFIEQRKKQDKDTKALKTTVNKANYEQRKYSNLDFLYANNIEKKGN